MMNLREKSDSVTIFTFLASLVLLAFMSTEDRYIALPALACTTLMIWLWMTLWKRDGEIPLFDVGVFCALATFIYTVFPLLNYWFNGLQFVFPNDSRLVHYAPSPHELGTFHLRHLLYFFCFAVAYLYFRGQSTIEGCKVCELPRSDQRIILFYFIFLTLFFILLEIGTGYSTNFSYTSESLEQHLETVSNMPLLLLQLSKKLWGIRFVFKLALLFIVISRCRQKRWLFILYTWMVLEIIQTILTKGARTDLVLFLMASILLYHRLIRPLRVRFLLTFGAFLILGFLFLGIYRSYTGLAELQTNFIDNDIGIFSTSNEFLSMLGTSYDVLMLKQSGIRLPWYLYINDFITILPPQQLLPFEKIRASEWYLRQIGLSGSGLGFMWGVITQSIIGLDWLEIALRGAILGYILARLHRWYIRNSTGFFETLVYMYFCLRVYYTFRDTTFSPLSNFIWEIIPFYILLRVKVILLPNQSSYSASHSIASSPSESNSQ